MKNKRESPASDGTTAQPLFHQRAAEIQAYGTINHLLPAIRVAGLRRRMMIEVHTGAYGHYRQDLLDSIRVATVPGVVFGPEGEGHVRLSFSVSEDTIAGGVEALDHGDRAVHPTRSHVRNRRCSFRSCRITWRGWRCSR